MVGNRAVKACVVGALSLLAVGAWSGCGTPSPKSQLQAEMQDLPAWALGKCEESLKDKSLLCASGSVQGMSSVSLARSAAEGRARTELSRTLEVRVKSILKDYQSATQGGPDNQTWTEQYIEDTSKQITDLTLSGSRVEETFVSNTGTFWALVVLDEASFKNSVQQADVDESVRTAIVERAEQAFAGVDAATQP